jgi:hypothetical protein
MAVSRAALPGRYQVATTYVEYWWVPTGMMTMTTAHPGTNSPTLSPSPSPSASAPPRRRRRVRQFLLDMLDALGRHPSIWDPWLFMTPRFTNALWRTDTSQE